ncbi:MAG: sulfite exporter TauE/SafE family protein [Victivallaceae bacterium]|nr:sulfite exporter TauE/SafE family protein [Victivallaceae bacterium]
MPGKTELLKWVWAGTIIVFAVGLVAITFIKELSPTYCFDNYYQLFVILMLLAFFAEYIDSSLGMGYGTTLTPLLIIVGFQPLQVVTALLFSEFISGITAGILHHKADNVDFIRDTKSRKVMLLMASCSIAGTLLAVTVALNLPKFYVRLYIGLMILAIGVFLILKSRTNYLFSWKRITVIGLLAAFNKGISGGGYGPLLTSGQLLSGIKEKNAVAITSMAEGLVCFVAVIIYLLSGTEFDWKLTIPLTLGAFISVPGAVLTVKIIPANFIRGQIAYVTLFLGILMVAKTILL